METKEICKALGARIKEIRKQRHLSQKELAAKINVNSPLLNKYESGLHAPPIDKLLELAKALNTTVDYLLAGNLNQEVTLNNSGLLERFQALENLDSDDRQMIIKLLDTVILKHRMETALKPLSPIN